MAIEVKEVIMYISKGLLFSIKTSYRTARGHPFIAGLGFLLLILYRMFPSLFAFLVTSSPVIVCTAVLLGTLLSYGAPNAPRIEGENRKPQEISSLQVGSSVGNLVRKKDESFAAEIITEVEERTVEEAALGQASIRACDEVARDAPSATMHDVGHHKDDTLLPASSADEDERERNSDKRLSEEGEVCDPGLVEKGEIPVEEQLEGALGLGGDIGHVSLRVQIAKPEPENPYDSSLGSPWHPIDSHDASSGSDSDSSGSSSPDASMADIIPMLDELHPLLDSEHPQGITRSAGCSDAASSGSSSDDESDDGNAEEKTENKEDRGKEVVQEEKHGGDEDAVTWNADDQKNVMDLGISELERNRRLESLIAKRRARKLMRYETEKNLLDINSYYPSPIPSISAPRRNPFDFTYDSVPGSAPSTLQPRENPFDLPYDQVEKISSFSKEYLRHHDFVSPPERDMFSGIHESSTFGPSSSVDLREEEGGFKLRSYYDTERLDSQESELTAFHRQLSEESDLKLSSASESNKVSSVTGMMEDHVEVLPKPQVRQESNWLPLVNLDGEHVEQDGNFFTELDSIDVGNEEVKEDAGDDPATNKNTSIAVEETHQPTDSSGAMEEEIGEAAATLPLSDAEKLDIVEERYESDSSTSEENDKCPGMDIDEESGNMEKMRNDMLQSDRDIDMPAAQPVYDSYPSSVGNSLSNTSLLDEALIYEGKEDFISSSLPSDVQADFSEEVVPSRKQLQVDPSLEDGDYVDVKESVGNELAYGIGGPSKASSSASSLDETESRSMEITETKEHDGIQVATVHVPELAAGEIMPISSFSSVVSESGEASSHVDKNTQSEGDHIMDVPPSREESVVHPSREADLEEESQVGILDLPLIPEDNTADFKFEEHENNTTEPTVICGITGLQVTKQQSSSDPKATEIIGNDDDGDRNELVHVEESSDSLVASSKIPTLSHSDGKITDEVGKESACLENYEESDDEVHAWEIKEIDEGLLSELDAVGDFQVDRDLKLDRGGSDVQSQPKYQFDTLDVSSAAMQRGASEARPTDDTVTKLRTSAEGTLGISKEVNPLMNQPALPKIELESSVAQSHEDPELTVLEACSLEELDSVFKQHQPSSSSSSGVTIASSGTSSSEVGGSELVVSDRDPEVEETDPQLQVLEAKSVQDISEGDVHKRSSASEFEPSSDENLPAGANADVEFLEAKSLEDIESAFKQLSRGVAKSLNPQDGYTEAEASQRRLESAEVFEVQSAAASEGRLEPEVSEGQDAAVTDVVVEKHDENSEGAKAVNAASSSTASVSKKIQKKLKSVKSGSSSSSSSSDSE